MGHDRLDDPPVSISRHLQQAADLLRRALVAEELLLALPDGRVLECEPARAAEGGVQGGGEEARHGEVLRSFRVAGRFAARSDWQADLGDFEREVDRDVRTIALDDQGGAGADGEARRPIGEQGERQARRHKASAVNFPSMTHRYRACTFSIAVAGALAIAACSTDDGGGLAFAFVRAWRASRFPPARS